MTAKAKRRDEMSPEDREVWARFDAEVREGFEDIQAGRLKDADELFDRLEAKYAAMSHRRV
jgi:predicted transcriptional regulator